MLFFYCRPQPESQEPGESSFPSNPPRVWGLGVLPPPAPLPPPSPSLPPCSLYCWGGTASWQLEPAYMASGVPKRKIRMQVEFLFL